MNLILQHWHDGANPPPIVEASQANLAAYARRIGAEHRSFCGLPFHPRLSPQAQKLFPLEAGFDSYEDVAMLDSDMFATPTCPNLFDHPGIGFHQEQAHQRACRLFPALTDARSGFYGGCLYKLTKAQRKALRAVVDMEDLKRFDGPGGGWDEGMMHRLCLLAKLPTAYLDPKWCWGGHWPDADKAYMIHVRTKPEKDKMKNYEALKARGVIA